MKSALYFGWVRHRRRTPVVNAFRYGTFYVYLDLAELDTVFRGRWLWSTGRLAPAWFRRADHLGDPKRPLDAAVRDLVAREIGVRPSGAVRLLTHLRYWGYCMNPVSFYYCFDGHAGGERLRAIVAEVHNTPWRERHCYVLDCGPPAGADAPREFTFPKAFHVSPFMPMDVDYSWRLSPPDQSLTVNMTNRVRGEEVFDATLVLERRPIDGRTLALALARHPFMTGKVIAAIYWQALKLWLKRTPYHPHPGGLRDARASAPAVAPPVGRAHRGLAVRLARRLVHTRLARLRAGALVVDDAGDATRLGAARDPAPPRLRVHDPRFYLRTALRGPLGFAESYLRGEWSAGDLTGLLRVFARDVAHRPNNAWSAASLALPAVRFRHWLRRNTRAGSLRNARAHYDLGNDFYRLILDDTMTYSCGIFDSPATTLREASIAKLDRVCRKLDLGPRHHVLEIGTGWGSFALHAARRYGCRVTTTTISAAQRELAIERVRAAGLEDRIEVLDSDYRDLGGTYDRLVTIEMIEAVGHARVPGFLRACAERLKPDGAMLLQCITIPDRDFETYRASVDFIQREVFPGSALPSLGLITGGLARTDLRIVHVDSIGPHYARTLRRWRAAFDARRSEVRRLGFDERFLRLWTYYLCYCEAGFAERYLDDLQIVMGRPAWRGESALGRATRDTPRRATAAATDTLEALLA